MSEISEVEIKAMSKEQNYLRGYSDGKSDTLDKIRAEIETERNAGCHTQYAGGLDFALSIIDKYKIESEDKE